MGRKTSHAHIHGFMKYTRISQNRATEQVMMYQSSQLIAMADPHERETVRDGTFKIASAVLKKVLVVFLSLTHEKVKIRNNIDRLTSVERKSVLNLFCCVNGTYAFRMFNK